MKSECNLIFLVSSVITAVSGGGNQPIIDHPGAIIEQAIDHQNSRIIDRNVGVEPEVVHNDTFATIGNTATGNSKQVLSRRRRYLSFPSGSSFQVGKWFGVIHCDWKIQNLLIINFFYDLKITLNAFFIISCQTLFFR